MTTSATSFRWRQRRALVWWTGGKDSAWAVQLLQQDPAWDLRGLFAPVNEKNGRVLLHGVRSDMLERQAAALRLPLRLIPVDWAASRPERDAAYLRALSAARGEDVEFVVFSDISSDQRRERRSLGIGSIGMEAVFPLWGRSAHQHARDLVAAGVSSRVCSVDTDVLPADLSGKRYDGAFVDALPPDVDPLGENSEFHTFVEWAPGWHGRVPTVAARTIEVYDLAFTEVELDELDGDATAGPSDGNQTVPRAATDPFSYFERLSRIRRYVDKHLAQHIDGDSIAEVAALTPAGFSKYFKRHVGTTFGAWLTRRRVEEACRLLRKHDDPVGQISRSVGFQSERTFRRAFHQHVGCSPSEYRKRLTDEAAAPTRPDSLAPPRSGNTAKSTS